MNNIIAERIKQRRIELGYSQEYLAHECGYSFKSAIHKIEHGINTVPMKKLIRFAEVLQTNVNWLKGLDVSKDEVEKVEFEKKLNSRTILENMLDENPNVLKILSVICKQYRFKRRISEYTIANRVSMNEEKYIEFELNGNNLTNTQALNLLNGLDISYDYIIGYVESVLNNNMFQVVSEEKKMESLILINNIKTDKMDNVNKYLLRKANEK